MNARNILMRWRSRPRGSLLAQVSWLIIGVMLVSTISYGLWYEARIARTNRTANDEQAQTFARTIASAAAPALVTRDAGALESLLMNLRQFPYARQLAVFDPSGKPRAVVNLAEGGAASLDYDLGVQTPPTDIAVKLLRVNVGQSGLIEVWAPVEIGVLAGWTRVRIDLQGEAQLRAVVWQQAVFSALLTTALTVLALFIFLRLRLKPVAQCAAFAERLASDPGATLEVNARSREVALLQTSLNDASLHLRQQYEAINERNERLDAIFALSPDGLVVFDRDRRLAYSNPAFGELSSLDVKAGMPLHEFERAMAACCAQSSDFTGVDTSVSGVTEIALIAPVRRLLRREHRLNQRGHLVLYFRDITSEAEVARMKSEFLSTAAHELRTPMVSVFGFVELLLARKYPEEKQREMLSVIHRQSRLLINMVNELLDLARIEARVGKDFVLSMQPLQPLIYDTCAAIALPSDHHVLKLDLPPESEFAEFDSDKLRLALSNVVSNAFKYSPQGGEVSVTFQYRETASGPQIGIAVRDQGIGMTPEQLTHAFERFYRADTSGKIPGTGLGLSLVKEVVTLHRGEVTLESEAGVGSCVTLWLPRRLAASESPLRQAA